LHRVVCKRGEGRSHCGEFLQPPTKPNSFLRLEEIMKWEAPDFEEISLCCEINSYASAEL
jgi:coenzyme PQQ precursor peptide PqqA